MQTYGDMVIGSVSLAGSVPREWKKTRVLAFAKERKQFAEDESEQLLSISEYFGVAPRSEKFTDSGGGSRDGSIIGYRVVRKNDLAMNYMLAWKGSQGVSDYDGVVSPAYAVFELDQSIVAPQFIHYLFRSELFQKYFKSLSRGIMDSRLRLYPETLLHLSVDIPQKAVQQRIADFLDTETAQIDNLIAKQERLLKLLEEKRRATITHAATRGLNPSVELTETNIPWLGQIPKHWRLEKIKYIANRRDEKIAAASGQKYIGLEHVESFTGKEISTGAQSEPEGLSLGYQQGDVLFGKLRPYLAKVIKATDSGICSSEFIVLSAEDKILPEFLKYSLLNNRFIEEVNSSTYGAKMPRANWDYIGNSYLPVPSIEEQESITHFIGQQDRVVAKLKQKIQTQITLLRERRTSLISHAVTGKIKV